MIGYEDQTVHVSVMAKSIDFIQERYDTYTSSSDLNTFVDVNGGNPPNMSLQTSDGQERSLSELRMNHLGDIFEIGVEFDLHDVMMQTQHSLKPAKPKTTLYKYK